MHHQPTIVRWSMPLCVTALVVLCLLPSAWLDWTNWFSAQARVAVSPIAHPMTLAKNLVIPQSVGNPNASLKERALQSELDQFRAQLYREQQENTQLRALVEQLSSGAAVNPDVSIKQIQRPVIGLSREFLIVRSGAKADIGRSTVVVANAVQLCGRVVETDDRTSLVLPITAKDAQPILGNVLIDNSGTKTARCMLEPIGNGLLEGDVTLPSGPGGVENAIRVGMEVRLLDDQWPRHAQMLLIGTIEKVAPSPNQPLRQRITVRPTVDLRAISDVLFRVPDFEDGGTP